MNNQLELFELNQLKVNNIKLFMLLKLLKKNKKNFKRWWVKPHLKVEIRNTHGVFNTIFKVFQLEDHESFKHYFRMSPLEFQELFDIVRDKLTKHSNREPIGPELRLALTLWILTQGSPVKQTGLCFRTGKTTSYNILAEVCQVIVEELNPWYMSLPNNQQWLEIAKDFYDMWNFPNCVGALDGKHIFIECPPGSGSIYFSHKKRFSIVLMAIADAHKRFIWYNVGDYGSLNDASIMNESDLSEKLRHNEIQLPPSAALPNTDVNLPHMFVADEIFGLQKHMMKPYATTLNMSKAQKIFNYRLKRARLCIECAFGILVQKFQILKTNIAFKVETSKIVAGALINIHNYLITKQLEPRNNNIIENQGNEIPMTPTEQRQCLTQYFSSPFGSIPYQEQYI